MSLCRPVDALGRIVIPMEIRRSVGIREGTLVDIRTSGKHIIMQKYREGCTECGELPIAVELQGIKLCKRCVKKINAKSQEKSKTEDEQGLNDE